MADKILVVGAGGFIGGFIARRALELGFDTWVAVRASTSRRYLTDARLHFVTLDYDDPDSLQKTLAQSMTDGSRWRYIIYNLGATKCANFLDFNRINFQYLRNFVTALRQADLVPEKFLYMSSLSAVGPGDETGYTPLTERDIPHPNTRYGLSKIKAESFLDTLPDFPYIIFRPTGVYGPHELDYLMMIKSIDAHFDFGMGFRRQMLTFIYVEDLVNAMFQALERGKLHARYIIAEGRAYTQSQFRRIVAEELGGKWVIPVRLPMWAVYVASVVAEKWGQATMKPSTLNRDKFKIMRQRNWDCDITAARRDFGFNPEFDLRRGIHETVKAYQADKRRKSKGEK